MKPNSKLVETPVTDIPGNPNDRKPGGGVWNGEPGWPSRTTGGEQLPEKTYDECGEFGKVSRD